MQNLRSALVSLALACALGLAFGLAACGGPARDAGTPMAGSAAILPSPVKAERVPASDESANPAPSASFAPATPTVAPTVTPPPASASVKKQ